MLRSTLSGNEWRKQLWALSIFFFILWVWQKDRALHISWLVLSNKVVRCWSLKNSLLPLCCEVMLLLYTNEAIPIVSSSSETRWGSRRGWLHKNLYLCSDMSFAMMQNPLSGFFFGGLCLLPLKAKSRYALVIRYGASSPRTVRRAIIAIDYFIHSNTAALGRNLYIQSIVNSCHWLDLWQCW